VASGRFDSGYRGWEGIKAKLNPLCGWYARRPELHSSDAWDVAYRHLLDLHEIGLLRRELRKRRNRRRAAARRPR
jgi:hypothetical protein